MDGIGKNITNVSSGSFKSNTSSAPAKQAKPEVQAQPKDEVSLQSVLKFTEQDLTSSGKVGVIIKSDNPEQLAKVKEKILENPNNTLKAELPIINGIAMELDPSANGVLADLTKSTGDIKLFLDQKVQLIEPTEIYDNDASVMMDVAGKTMNIDKVWDQGFKGKGMTIAVIDTGIAPHPDFGDRIVGFKDFVNNRTEAYDDQGHGTHCAGISAGDGKASEGKFAGAAPEANLVGIKVLDKNGSGSFSNVIAGIQWAVENKDEFGIDIINMSLGGYASQSYKNDPVAQAVQAAVEKGIVTVIAAGNEGPGGKTIGTPATAPNVISVGALDDKGTVDRSDDDVAYFSSRGPTRVDNLAKPDILTPGVRITAPKHIGDGYTTMSGTSMAAPLAAGMAALVKQAVPTVSPGELKGVMMGTADDLNNLPHTDQGAGVFNVVATIEKLTGQKFPVPEQA